MQPFFSIILTTFNRAHLLERAVASVIAQQFENWELLIIDDGSQDHTRDLVLPYVLRDRRITYHAQQNHGTAYSRNAGIRYSQGDYITFLDSDDEYLPDHLATRHQLLESDPSIDLLHGGIEVIGEEYVADKYDPTKKIAISDCVVGGTFFINRTLIEKAGLFDDTILYSDDSAFFERAVVRGANIVKTSIPTYRYYRTEADSLCMIVERGGLEGIKAYREGRAV